MYMFVYDNVYAYRDRERDLSPFTQKEGVKCDPLPAVGFYHIGS
jgi:hypothetical protein